MGNYHELWYRLGGNVAIIVVVLVVVIVVTRLVFEMLTFCNDVTDDTTD